MRFCLLAEKTNRGSHSRTRSCTLAKIAGAKGGKFIGDLHVGTNAAVRGKLNVVCEELKNANVTSRATKTKSQTLIGVVGFAV